MSESSFGLLLECLKKNLEIHLHIIWGTLALQIAAIGWFLSSEAARTFIAEQNGIRAVGMVAIIVIAIIHFCLLYGTYRASEALATRIARNEYYQSLAADSSATVGFWRIDRVRMVLRGLFTFTLFVSLVYLVFRCSPPALLKDAKGAEQGKGRACCPSEPIEFGITTNGF